MQLPNNSEAFKSIVVEKIKTYCDTNIWPFEYESFSAWLNNFKCKTEEYVALQILDHLIVRSYEMAKASYARLLHGEIRQHLLESTDLDVGSIQKWKSHLTKGTLCQKLRFAPVKLDSDQGESGSVIYRMLSKEIDTSRYSLARAKQTPEVLILIDDFIGSGSQFDEYAKEISLIEQLKKTHIIYCPLIGFEVGIDLIKSNYPALHILPAEYIFKSDSLFFKGNGIYFKNDQINTITDVEKFLSAMKIKYAPKMPNWFGFDEAGLPLAFEWGCPNQTPALLYLMNSKNNSNWNQLFSRRA
jgi:hypothetical protein